MSDKLEQDEQPNVPEADEPDKLLPLEFTLFIEHGFDLSDLNHLEKGQSKLQYISETSVSLFRVMNHILLDPDANLNQDLAKLASLGESMNYAGIGIIDTLEETPKKRRGKKEGALKIVT